MFNTETTINGTFGEVSINNEVMSQATGLEAKVSLEKQEVNQTGTLSKGYKITGIEGKGTVKLNKTTSYFIRLMSDNLKQGKQTVVDIMTSLEDPAALGAERILLKGCTFDELTLADWEAKKLGEESYAFTFTDWELLDVIEQ